MWMRQDVTFYEMSTRKQTDQISWSLEPLS